MLINFAVDSLVVYFRHAIEFNRLNGFAIGGQGFDEYHKVMQNAIEAGDVSTEQVERTASASGADVVVSCRVSRRSNDNIWRCGEGVAGG